MIIRELKIEDVESVENIYSLYWQEGEFRKKLSRRLQEAVNCADEFVSQRFKYLVVLEDKNIVGIVSFRKVPQHLQEFTQTNNSAELYIIAVINRGLGIGTQLVAEALKEIKKLGYSEVVLYSGETHHESWVFYDKYGFKRVREAVAPDGEKGVVWGMMLE